MSPTLGVILLDADHAVETLGTSDPFSWEPPVGLTTGFYGHPGFWPYPTLFAVPAGATAATTAAGEPEALEAVAAAVRRLDGKCDLIIGSCGFFASAWDHLPEAPATPTFLSGFDLLDAALASTSLPVVVLSFAADSANRLLEQRRLTARVRAVGISPAGDWPLIARPDWATAPRWTIEGLERGLRQVMELETGAGGSLVDVGAIVLECTILPQFRRVIREYTSAPIYDVGTTAIGLIS